MVALQFPCCFLAALAVGHIIGTLGRCNDSVMSLALSAQPSVWLDCSLLKVYLLRIP